MAVRSLRFHAPQWYNTDMITLKAQKIGGQIMAERQRQKAIELYMQDPNLCLFCEKAIGIAEGQKVSEVRKKKFCNHSCCASYHNRASTKRPPKIRICLACKQPAKSRSGLCLKCHNQQLTKASGKQTKSELFGKRSGYQSARSHIRRHAALSYARSEKPACCFICGYDTYVEVCHIHPVRDFPGGATLAEINHPDNPVALCPNHHWEFDHGILKI
jgi:hypothetical protein